MRYTKFLRLLVVILAATFVGVSLYEPPTVEARGWRYKLKKPPKKRPKPPKKRRNQYIQEDPLRIVKSFTDPNAKIGPNIVIAMDTSMRMQYDFEGWYYDERYWRTCLTGESDSDSDCDGWWHDDWFDWATSRAVATSLGVSPRAKWYRRKYKNLVRTEVPGSPTRKTQRFDAESIVVADNLNPEFLTFYDPSRLGMARDGLLQVVEENMYAVNFGLVRTRHGDQPRIPYYPGNDYPVYLSSDAQKDLPGDLKNKSWRVTWLKGRGRNVDQTSTNDTIPVQVIERSDASAKTAWWLMQPVDSSNQDNTLVPAGYDDGTFQDSPVRTLLEDAHRSVLKAMEKDSDKYVECRNTAVILVVGGKDGGGADPVPIAETFRAVTYKKVTRSVPIYVIAVGPPAEDVPQLQAIAAASGGEYFEVYDATQVAFAGNYAVQSIFRRASEFDANKESEFQVSSPIVGSVDLTNARDIDGNPLPNTTIYSGGAISQGANTVITTAFSLPGFEARIRAFRAYKPTADASRSTGYKYEKDGTPLWVARHPGADQRNIYTYLPGAGYVAFTQANRAVLLPYLSVDGIDEWAEEIINFVRQQPLGAPISSTPALMSPPSMSPAPGASYRAFQSERRNRRATVFYGGNDGMIHGIDGRLGVESWAFIPFNMLPALQTLKDGQPVDYFEYFVDASPKIADVEVGGRWRTYLFIGNGAGGTYYNAFDVSDAGLGVSPTSDSADAVLQAFSNPEVIPFVWSYPEMSTFDHEWSSSSMPYGDIKASASREAKQVGQTWSTPAVGQVGDESSPWVVLVGSGYLPPDVQSQANRGNVRAGTTFYVLDAATGRLLASHDVGDDSSRESLKNALVADPSTASGTGSRFIDTVYLGDLEGGLWRYRLSNSSGTIRITSTREIYDAYEWNPFYQSAAVMPDGAGGHYVFTATGSDVLPWTLNGKVDHFSILGVQDTGGLSAVRKFEYKLDKVDSAGADERPTDNPSIAGGVVFFTTTTEYPDTPCQMCETSLWALGPSGNAAYDLNGDGRISNPDQELKQTLGRATSVYVADKHLYFGTDQGLSIFGDPEGFNNSIVRNMFRTLAWRDVR